MPEPAICFAEQITPIIIMIGYGARYFPLRVSFQLLHQLMNRVSRAQYLKLQLQNHT